MDVELKETIYFINVYTKNEKDDLTEDEKKDMSAKTYIVSCEEYQLIDEIIQIRKEQNVSQTEVAKVLGVKQQAISRFENKENSPSLKFFYSIVDALGYKIKIEKK